MSDSSDKAALMEAMVASRDDRKSEILEDREASERERQAKALRAKELLSNIKKPFDHMMPNSEKEEEFEEREMGPHEACPMCGSNHEKDYKMEEGLDDKILHKSLRRMLMKRRINREEG